MRNKFFMLLLAPMVLSCTGCQKEEKKKDLGPVNVVLISGQSNAVGCSRSNYIKISMSEEKYDEFAHGYDDVLISYDCWTKDGFDTGNYTYYSQNASKGFVPVKLGQGNGPETFGPEIGIAEELHERFGGKLFIIKYACGASNLKDDWTQKDSPMYPRFIKYVKAEMKRLVKQGYQPTIKAFCWMQGEGDTYDSTYYARYKENTRTFVGNVRQDLFDLAGQKEIPFIDAKISGTGGWTFWSQVNTAKREFSQESDNNFLVDTIQAGMTTTNEPTPVDIAHYDSSSEVLLGHLFAQTFEQFLDNGNE